MKSPGQTAAVASDRRGPGTAGGQGIAAKLALSAVVTALTLGALEMGASFFLKLSPPPPVSPDTVTQTLQWLSISPVPLVKDVDLLWSNEPRARRTQPINPRPFGREDQWTIENNSEGFRGPERDRSAPNDAVYRILCVGDSVTFGFNADQGDAFPAQLERTLRQRHPDRRIEVVNAGVPGWTWLQGLRFLETRGLRLRPDLVIVAHGTNDRLMTATVTDAERLRWLSQPLPRLLQSLRLHLEKTSTFRGLERLAARPARPDFRSPGCSEQLRTAPLCKRVSLPEIENAIFAVEGLLTGAGSELAVLNLDFMNTDAVSAARSAAEQHGLWFVDFVERVTALQHAADSRRSAELGLAAARGVYDPGKMEIAPTRVSWQGLVRVLVPQAERSYWIQGGSEGPSVLDATIKVRERLYDDGTHGDERPRDGVFSTQVELPRTVGAFTFKFHQDEAAEFTPLPPLHSRFGDRLFYTSDDFISPVYVFGESLYMAERTHPNAEGHALVADEIADALETRDSFRHFVSAATDSRR